MMKIEVDLVSFSTMEAYMTEWPKAPVYTSSIVRQFEQSALL